MSNKYHKTKKSNAFPQKILSTLLGVGVMLATTHGAPFVDKSRDVSPVDFKTKVIKDLHTHTDFAFAKDRVIIDPRSLRSVRSEGDKLAELDLLNDSWSIYRI